MRLQQTGLPPLTGEVAKPKVLTEGFTPLRKEKYEMKRFLSLLLAAVLLLALAACGGNVKDVQTKEKIAVPSITLLCNSADRWDIERTINGQLGSGNGTIGSLNMQSLPIDTIIEYDHGITHGKKWGKKVLSFPGVQQGKAYLFVPGEAFFVAVKRPLTMETGRGSVLQLSTEEKAWYAVQAEHYKDFLGSSYPGTNVGAGFGYIVEVTLPVEA